MKNSELEKRRRRIYKGLPGLKAEDRERGAELAINSAYFWWFEYLKLSKNYWWLCQERNLLYCKSDELIKVGDDFGDVFGQEFRDWWIKTGSELFVEQLELPKVRHIDSSLSQLSVIQQDKVIVEIPLNLTEQTIKRQVLEIIRSQSQREIKRSSSARRKLARLKRVPINVLEKAREIWCLNEIARLANAKVYGFEHINPEKLSLYEIGKKVRLVNSCMPKPTDGLALSRKKRNGMKVAVKRMLLRADALIANVELGLFPSFDAPSSRRFWTDSQEQKLDTAISNGLWLPDAIAEQLRKL